MLSIIATGVAGLMLFVSIGGLIFQISQNASETQAQARHQKLLIKMMMTKLMQRFKIDSKSDSKVIVLSQRLH
ncbi:MAG: hypothetical protein ACLS3S_02410 [Streptococcus salivarius]